MWGVKGKRPVSPDLLSATDYSDTFRAPGKHPTRVGGHSERGFGARNLLYLAFRQKQIPRCARDDNTRCVSIFREAQYGGPNGSLRRGEEGGEKSSADGHGLDEYVLVSGMRAITDGAEAIERRDTQRRGEVPVRASTGRGFAQGKAQLLGEGSSASEENGALLAFERRAIK